MSTTEPYESDFTEKRRNEKSDYDNGSLLSKALFLWAGKIVKLGASKILEIDDLPPISVDDDAHELHRKFSLSWKKELESESPSLIRAIVRVFFRSQFLLGLILLAESALRIFQAVLLGLLINYFLSETSYASNDQDLYKSGYFLSFLLTLCGTLVTFMHHHFFFFAWRLGMQLRIMLTAVIYEKSLRLSLDSLSKTSTGHIMNLCSQDIESFQQAGCFVHFTYAPILECIGILYVGLSQLGYSFLAGFGAILLLVPLQSVFSRLLSLSKKATAGHTDERLKLVSQALTGARLMKINGWENMFVELIESIRSKEIAALLSTNSLRAYNEAIFFVSPVAVGCFTFITYSSTGGVLTPQKVFTTLTLFNIMQFSMTKFFPYAIQFLTEAQVNLLFNYSSEYIYICMYIIKVLLTRLQLLAYKSFFCWMKSTLNICLITLLQIKNQIKVVILTQTQ
jgi:ABC-type multidrug transport system fused ATPase/permease subunit